MNHRQLRIFQFQLLCLNRIYLWSFLDEDINTKQHLFWMHNFGEEQDGTFLNVFFHYFRDGVPPYFTCLVSDGAVFCSSDIMQCVHPILRTVLNRALVSQCRWVWSIFGQFYSIIWLLSVCIGMTAFNFVSSLLIRSHYAQFNTRLRRWEILIRDTEYVYRAASHFGLTFSTSHVWCARISAFYKQDCLRSILRWGGLYFRLFISSERKCVWSPFEFV
jgi:hypothetical protein